MISALAEGEPLVAFVGAGASAMPPSRLPTWIGFNDLLLECLCERLGEYSRNRQPTDAMLSALRDRRDESHFLPPDFQAQLIEEEVGADYFRVWQSIETDVFGPAHAGIAELAKRGRLAAVVTTNFDRLIEGALGDYGVDFDVFHDEASFDALDPGRRPGTDGPLPVIKIHGSIEDPSSLVDTLRQRLVGRPEALTDALRELLVRHRWMFLGFSGADFDYDPGYLGILGAADEARGFVFLAREGRDVRDGVRSLAAAYGHEKASITFGDLATWLQDTFDLPAPRRKTGARDRPDTTARVKERIRDWVERLSPVAVVNILYSMLKTSGMEPQAHWLLRRTWKSYRTPDDTAGASYARFNYNFGLSLLDAGFVSNPVRLEEDMSNLIEWKEHADQNAFEFFSRSYREGGLLAAGAHLAALLGYRGELGKAVSLAGDVTDHALEQGGGLELCDVAMASVVIYDLLRFFGPPVGQLRRCLEVARTLGDEPRRAMLSAHLARFLTYGGRFDEADERLVEAEEIGRRLDLDRVTMAAQAVRGRWLTDSGASDPRAVRELRAVLEAMHARDDVPLFTQMDLGEDEPLPVEIKGRRPTLCRVLLDLNRAARFAGDAEVMNRTLDELDEVTTEYFPGYCPHYYLTYAECLLHHGDPGQQELMPDLLGRALRMGELTQNPWVAQAVEQLRSS